MDLRTLLSNAQSSISNSYDNSVESLIDRLGLERQRSSTDQILPALGVFGAGLAIGAALGLIFAPKRGEELRGDINDQLDHLKDRIDHLSVKSRRQYEELLSRGGELVESAKSHLPDNKDIDEAAHKVAKKVEKVVDQVSQKVESTTEKTVEAAKDLKEKAEDKAEKVASELKK